MDAGGEVVDVGLLTTQIEDTNLGVGNTTVEPGLGVGLNAGACQYSILPNCCTGCPPSQLYKGKFRIFERSNDQYIDEQSQVVAGVMLKRSPTSELPHKDPKRHRNQPRTLFLQ